MKTSIAGGRKAHACGVASFVLLILAALCLTTGAQTARVGSQVTVRDLGVLPGGTSSRGLAINDEPTLVGLATDSNLALQRPFWDANTGVVISFADNFNPASTAIPEHLNNNTEMAGTEVYGDNVYQGIYWNAAGQAFSLLQLAGVDPAYGALHTKAHGINNLGQIVGAGKEAEPNFYTHAVLWQNKDTPGLDLGFLGQGTPVNYSEAYGINDLGHVVGVSAVGSPLHGFLWRNGQLTDLGALGGQVASEAKAINNTGRIAGKSNLYPVYWTYDMGNPNSIPTITQLPIPAGFFAATTTAVNDAGDVVGYAGSPNIDSHAVLWRNGAAIDLGVFPGGHYSVANGINSLGQIVGTGTVAGDNLDHALLWTVDNGTPNTTPTPTMPARPNKIRVGGSVTVKASFTDPDNGPWNYTVNWGDGNTTTGNASVAGKISGISPHVYNQPGTFNATLSVTDALGASGVSSPVTIKVR